MKKCCRQTHIHPLLLVLLLFTSCHGQVSTKLPGAGEREPQTIPEGHPKMVRTQGIKSGNVGCALQDKAGNIWFNTGGEGIYRYDGQTFTNFTTKDGLCDNNVSAIIEDKMGNIVFGTRSGLCQYDGKSFSSYAAMEIPADLRITCLLEDRDGKLWFGTMGHGIYRYDGFALTNFLNNNDHPFNLGEPYQLILDILQDKNGHLWFSSWNRGGVWRYDGKTFVNYLPPAEYYRPEDSLPDYPLKDLSQDYISDDMIFSMAEDKAGNLWFATRNHGACRFDGVSFTTFGEPEGFVSTGVYSILEDKKGNIWLTTDKDGVFRYDGKTFKNFTTASGLVNNSVFSSLEDMEGNLWFGARWFGLSRYDGKTFVSFSE